MSDLLDVLEARAGIVCAVGAGGKKTTLYRLADLHPGRVGLVQDAVIGVVGPQFAEAVVIARQVDEIVVRRVAVALRTSIAEVEIGDRVVAVGSVERENIDAHATAQ